MNALLWLPVFVLITLASGEVWTTHLINTSLVKGTEFNPYTIALKRRPWKSVQNYVQVRPGAFLFYWLYYADGTSKGADRKPLIIWIQGGPGLAATGVANFAELGPLNMDMQPRNHTWVNGRNVLLIDHPVGTGFSYATNDSSMAQTDREMAEDLAKLIRVFLKKHKSFRKTPTYMFGQSYGGKLSPRLGYYLHTAIENKRLKMNFKGIGIGSGWVSPIESTMVQPDLLYLMGIIDQTTYARAKRIIDDICFCLERNDYTRAIRFNSILFTMFHKEATININFNNMNQVSPYPELDKLTIKVNKYVKPMLSHVVNQSLHWEYGSEVVFSKLYNNFFVPTTKFLEMLLNRTKLKIAVYNGNLDIVTPLAGATNWVHKLQWPGAREFKDAKSIPIRGSRNGSYKTARQLSLWSVFGAGHWVPEDNPTAMAHILEYIMTEEPEN